MRRSYPKQASLHRWLKLCPSCLNTLLNSFRKLVLDQADVLLCSLALFLNTHSRTSLMRFMSRLERGWWADLRSSQQLNIRQCSGMKYLKLSCRVKQHGSWLHGANLENMFSHSCNHDDTMNQNYLFSCCINCLFVKLVYKALMQMNTLRARLYWSILAWAEILSSSESRIFVYKIALSKSLLFKNVSLYERCKMVCATVTNSKKINAGNTI